MSDFDIPKETYDRIKKEIESSDSPVGIDAKKAHVIIIEKLLQIERRLDAMEKRIAGEAPGSLRSAPEKDSHQ